MKYTSNYVILSGFSLMCALFIFAFTNKLIIIRSPFSLQEDRSPTIIEKKQVTLFYFHQTKWKTETQELLWTHNAPDNLYHLINTWLSLLDEEYVLHKKIILQSVLITSSGQAYLSFDHNILPKEKSIFEKWMLIEGLLQTISFNKIPIKSIQLLVHYQQLIDPHLDFSQPWPIHGFN